MSHTVTKLPSCPNCDFVFAAAENFCPNCGQQNHALDLSFGHVAEEVVEGLFHFDGKVFRTLRLLLFAPGELTLRFWQGKRVAFVPPVRLYVFISFLFFLLLSLAMHAPEGHGARTIGELYREANLQFRADSVRLTNTLPPADSARLRTMLSKRRQMPLLNGIVNLGVNSDTADYRRWGGILYTPQEWKALPTYSNREVDALYRHYGKQSTFGARLLLQQARQANDSTEQEISHQFVRGISLMMFVLMPLFALLLKLLYLREKKYYLAHLMFAIHLHCLAFLLLGLNIVLVQMAHVPSTFILFLLALLVVYLGIALHTVYQQTWLKTTGKTLLLVSAYIIVITAGLLGALGISVALV